MFVDAETGALEKQTSAKARFMARLEGCFRDGSFVKLTVGKPAGEGGPRKLLLRPVVIRAEKQCSVVSRFATRDETRNYLFEEALALVEAKLGREFLSANLFTEGGDAQLELGGKERLSVTPATRAPAPLDHDRRKVRWIDAGARYLQGLGVTDAQGKVRERMGDKFRQIERFVDLLASAFHESRLDAAGAGAEPVTVCDMGSGKGYLTFAAYDYFARVEKMGARITGIEAREELVTICNGVARDCGYEGLRFVRGEIAEQRLGKLDVLMALHACDTATDDALFGGVEAGAEIILAAPCCHKEARAQVDRAQAAGPLRDVLRNGIFAERHAEMATDALRQLLLERAGYRVRICEFVAAEHTAKNVMLIATRANGAITDEAKAGLDRRIAELKSFYGIAQHRLEQLFLA